MKTKEVLDSIEQSKNKFIEKLYKLNEMPKKQQHWLDGHWSGHVNAYEHVLSLIDVRFEMWQEEQKVTALWNELKEVKERNEKLNKENSNLLDKIRNSRVDTHCKIQDLHEQHEKMLKKKDTESDDLREDILALNRDIKAIELERDRTEDKYNTLHELLLKATKIGLNK